MKKLSPLIGGVKVFSDELFRCLISLANMRLSPGGVSGIGLAIANRLRKAGGEYQ